MELGLQRLHLLAATDGTGLQFVQVAPVQLLRVVSKLILHAKDDAFVTGVQAQHLFLLAGRKAFQFGDVAGAQTFQVGHLSVQQLTRRRLGVRHLLAQLGQLTVALVHERPQRLHQVFVRCSTIESTFN